MRWGPLARAQRDIDFGYLKLAVMSRRNSDIPTPNDCFFIACDSSELGSRS